MMIFPHSIPSLILSITHQENVTSPVVFFQLVRITLTKPISIYLLGDMKEHYKEIPANHLAAYKEVNWKAKFICRGVLHMAKTTRPSKLHL